MKQNSLKGLYATLSSWHIDPCRFPVKCGGDMFAGQLILLPINKSLFQSSLFDSLTKLNLYFQVMEQFDST